MSAADSPSANHGRAALYRLVSLVAPNAEAADKATQKLFGMPDMFSGNKAQKQQK